MRRMTCGLYTAQTLQPLTSNPCRAVRWPLSGEWRRFVSYDCQSRPFLTSARCHNWKRNKQDISRSPAIPVYEACRPSRAWAPIRSLVRGTTRVPRVRPSKLAVYPTAERTDDARYILEYRTSSTSGLVSAQIPDSTRALLTSHTSIPKWRPTQ